MMRLHLAMSTTRGSTTIMRLNERRQMAVIAELADEHEVRPASQGGGVVAVMAGAPWLCSAIGCGLESALTDEGAKAIASYIATRGGRPRIVLTDQSTKPEFAALARAGLVLEEVERVLARGLDTPIHTLEVSGLTIERLDATDRAAVEALARFTMDGFAEPGKPAPAAQVEAMIRSQKHPRSRGFWAFVDGEPAATCGMEVVSISPMPGQGPIKVASLWGATVDQRFRRRGIQQALIAHRLRQGQEEGCALAVIECEPGIPTERNAARLGFTLAYTRLAFAAPVAADETSG